MAPILEEEIGVEHIQLASQVFDRALNPNYIGFETLSIDEQARQAIIEATY